MVMNALAAVAVGREFGVAGESVTEALASFRPQPMRMEVIHVDSLHILNDTYNANPASMRAALQTLREVSGTKRKIAVLGDMLELGEWASRVHRDIGQLAAQSGLAYLLTVGELSRLIAEEAMVSGMAGEQVHHVSGVQEALAFLRETARSGDAILVKGSRQMGLEAVVEGLRKQFTASTTSQGAK
jgi:UDP-N-acetylmuramoyl-tripeptide--D-alanyl-D-alanine ligase